MEAWRRGSKRLPIATRRKENLKRTKASLILKAKAVDLEHSRARKDKRLEAIVGHLNEDNLEQFDENFLIEIWATDQSFAQKGTYRELNLPEKVPYVFGGEILRFSQLFFTLHLLNDPEEEKLPFMMTGRRI